MTPADLKSWRLARGLTQAQAAQLLNLSVSYIAHVETGTDSKGNPIAEVPPRIELATIKADRVA